MDETTIAPEKPGLALRILRFPLTLFIVEFILVVLVASLTSALLLKAVKGLSDPLHLVGAVIVAVAAILAYLGCRRWIEGLAGPGEYGGPGAAKELGLGLLGGFALFSAMTGVVALLGGFEITGHRFPGQLWAMLAMAVTSSVTEETLFRGIAFRHLETMLGSWAALAITSAFFGAAHLMNPNATGFAALAIALEAGILLGGAYMLTRRLWAAIGIHAAWNFTQGWVFSVPVSGGAAPLGLFASRRIGPDWLTGGDFGLEASAVAMVAATLAGVVLVFMAVRRGRVVRPMWAR